MLIELPTADEIDALAITTPRFEVMKLDFERENERADLNYTPCKGQVVLVIRGEPGIALVRKKGEKIWYLPSGRIGANEDIERSGKRVAKEQCGLMLRSLELAAIYDVAWHFSNVSIKRLHVVYAALTDDAECIPGKLGEVAEARFFEKVPQSVYQNEIYQNALLHCSTK